MNLLPALALTLCFLAPIAQAEDKPSKPVSPEQLQREITAMDDALTDTFNRHDLAAAMALFSEDVEFFHDRGGLEIYPIPGYGAIQIGKHRFCHTENGKPDCGTFSFTHVWRKTGERWQLVRVVSYGH